MNGLVAKLCIFSSCVNQIEVVNLQHYVNPIHVLKTRSHIKLGFGARVF
jgi:hypothetical protein